MAATQNKFFLGLAALNAVMAFGHTNKGREQFRHLSLEKLPVKLRGAVQTGWYEGSMFFAIMSVLNYKWSQAGVLDIFDKSIIGMYATLLLGAGTSYFLTDDSTTGIVLGTVGVLESLAAYRAA